MGSSLSVVLANKFMEWFENRIFVKNINKHKLWLRYVDDTFVIWSHGRDHLDQFLQQLNNEENSIKFTVEIEEDKKIPLLDVLVIRENSHISTTVFRKPTHMGQYIHKLSNHLDHVKRGVIRSLHALAISLCSSKNSLDVEINHIFNAFEANSYSKKFIRNCIADNKKPERPNAEVKGSLIISYVCGVSEKIRKIAAAFGLHTAFHSRHTLGKLLPVRKPADQNFDTKMSSIVSCVNVVMNTWAKCADLCRSASTSSELTSREVARHVLGLLNMCGGRNMEFRGMTQKLLVGRRGDLNADLRKLLL